MARAHCLIKPKGRALIGVPIAQTDVIVWNAAKLYNNVMLPHLFANWKQIYSEVDYGLWKKTQRYSHQPLFVLEKQ